MHRALGIQPDLGAYTDLLSAFIDLWREPRARDVHRGGQFIVIHDVQCTFGHDVDDRCICAPTLIAPSQSELAQ